MTTGIDETLTKARECEERGDFEGARATLETVPAGQRTGAWFFARGSMALREGVLDEAVSHFEQAVTREPEVAEYRGNLGAALLDLAKRGDALARKRALVELEAAVTWGPTLPTVHTNLAVARLINADAKGALAAADEALRIDPRHLPALFNRAAALNALGDFRGCLSTLDAVLALAPSLPAAQQAKASVLKRLGQG